jgi:aryl-alcohol dehydrogenase-like predicted oxidoreductase
VSDIKKLGLGTVQWGLPYGLANNNGIVSPQIVTKLLAEARQSGIEILDTAAQYGTSEAVLGENSLESFKVVTKTPSFKTTVISDNEIHCLRKTFLRSQQLFAGKKIYALLIHYPNDLIVPGGSNLVSEMRRLKDMGFVEKIGVSVYDEAQVDAVLKVFVPDVIQLPLSVLDQRLLASGHLELLKNLGIEIHVRSVFLQGLLLMPMASLPAFFDPIRSVLTRWHDAASAQRLTATQAALAFVKRIPYVDTVLVGLDNASQFRACVDDFSLSVEFDARGLDCSDPVFLNPSFWQRT